MIPTKNSGDTLEKCLKHIHEAVNIRNLWLIDANSKDKTIPIAKGWGAEIVKQKTKTIGGARQEILDFICSPIFLTVDSDAYIPKPYQELTRYFRDPLIGFVTGKIIFGDGSFRQKISEYNYTIPSKPQPSLAAMWMRLSIIQELGFKDLSVSEDSELTIRILASKYKRVIDTRNRFNVSHPQTLTEELQSLYWWGGGYAVNPDENMLLKFRHLFGGNLKTTIVMGLKYNPVFFFYIPFRCSFYCLGYLKKKYNLVNFHSFP